MAAAKTIDSWKKKKWYQIVAPQSFNEILIGESPAAEPNLMLGRKAKLSLMVLSGNVKKQNINLTFKVAKVSGDKALTEPWAYELVPAYIKRLVSRGHNRLDESYILETADNKKVAVKIIAVTKSKTTSSVKKALRELIRDALKYFLKINKFEDTMVDLTNHKLQKIVKEHLNKVYPLKTFEIRVLEICEGTSKPLEADIEKLGERFKPKEKPKDPENAKTSN